MVKSLADELAQILDWIEDASLTQVEHARTALVVFCRGFICGLRAANEQPFVADEGRFKPDCPADKWDRPKMESAPSKECLKDS